MYLYIFIVCVNTMTSMIKTNALFNIIDFQAARLPPPPLQQMLATVQQRQRQWRQQQEVEGDTALPSEEEYRARLQYYLVSLPSFGLPSFGLLSSFGLPSFGLPSKTD